MNLLAALLALTLPFFLAISFANSPTTPSPLNPQPSTSSPPIQSSQVPTPSPSSTALSDSGSPAVAHAPCPSPSLVTAASESNAAPSPCPSPSPSPSPSASEEQVFIPLKEWKQRKLQHIESRVRNGQIRHSPTPQPLRRSLRRYNICRRPIPLRIFSRVCCLHEPAEWTIAPQASIMVDPTSKSQQSHVPPEAQPSSTRCSENRSDQASTSTEKPSSNTEHDNTSQLHAREPAHSDLPVRLKDTASSDPPHDELAGSRDQNLSVLTGLPIPKLPDVMLRVGSIVRSIMDASYLFSAPPLPVISTSKPLSRRSERPSATNISTSNSSTRATTGTRFNSSSSVSKENHNLSANFIDRSPSKQSQETDHPELTDAAVQHSLQGAKEKPFNFAAADAGARVLAYSEGVVGAKNVLIGSVDKYLLAPCEGVGLAGSRWVDLELSEDVILESIETANFEYYSSSARRVAVLGAGSYPPKRWNVLGVFDFRNIKTVQRFQISKRVVTRFLRVVYAGKQGNEYYCPVSTIRAFGKNLIADWKDVFEKQDTHGQEEVHSSKEYREGESRASGTSNAARGASDVTENAKARRTVPKASSMDRSGMQGDEIPTGPSAHPTMDGNRHEQIDNTVTTSDPHVDNDSNSFDGTISRQGEDEEGADQKHPDAPASLARDEKRGGEEGAQNSDSTTDDSENDAISEEDRIVMEAVRADTLNPVAGDDNIFRKVTRMIQLLELNQTLTNQYIDSQLSKFAKALSTAQSKSGAVDERVALVEKQMMQVVIRLEARVDELLQRSYRRDIIMCMLLVCLAFLVGSQWFLWTSVSGTRQRLGGEQRVFGIDSDPDAVDALLETEEVGSPITTKDEFQVRKVPCHPKRKKRKTKKSTTCPKDPPNEVGEAHREDRHNKKRWHGRSASSIELLSLPLSTQTIQGSGGAFHVLRSNGGDR